VAEIKMPMSQHVATHPKLRYLFFGGKGGVGKTVFAGATAIGLARAGRRTLLVSTNPVHSLTSLFGYDMLGKHVAVEGVPNLWGYEIDTRQTIELQKVQIREKIRWFLKFADITTKADEFVETATMNPAFEESAMFENMIDVMFKNEYEAYVFDTAPTANARRLLGMSKVYSLWVDKMLKSREEARTLREMLSFTKKKEEDPLMTYLVGFRERMEHARGLLTDPALTAFYFVTLPEALPIAVVTRFIQWFKDFGIPVGGVLVNMVMDPAAVGADAAEFVRNRVAMQQEHMRTIWREFDDSVRAVVPLFETEVRGVEMLKRLCDAIFLPGAEQRVGSGGAAPTGGTARPQ
jgi:arsenite-transporting ATPase